MARNLSFLLMLIVVVASCSPKVAKQSQAPQAPPAPPAPPAESTTAQAEPKKANALRVEAVEPWFQVIVPGMEDGEERISMGLPLRVEPSGVTVDSVYFKGMKTPLRKGGNGEQVIYKCAFGMKSGQKAAAPMELGKKDAAVVCHLDGKRHVIRIDGLKEKEPLFAP